MPSKLKDKPKEKPKVFCITVGNGTNDASDTIDGLGDKDISIEPGAQRLIRNHFPSGTRNKVKKFFEEKTVKEIGFEKGASLVNIALKLRELGYKFANGEDAGELARNHPYTEPWTLILSDIGSVNGELETIETLDALLFMVKKNGERLIRGLFSGEEATYDENVNTKEYGKEAKFLVYMQIV